MGGRAAVLQDKIPELRAGKPRARPGFMQELDKPQIMFVTMFDPDEPIDAIIEASRRMPEYVCYLTGNYKKIFRNRSLDENVETSTIFTGFVSDEDYLSLMENSDLVVVLTKKDLILNCGAYEAISFNKPLILSDTATLRDYFNNIAVYTKNDSRNIEESIKCCLAVSDSMVANVIDGKVELKGDWENRFIDINEQIKSIEGCR
ncbi:glycosyltransferase [Marinobacter sp. TBZ242]|uniref:Glycosyltransferase n=1 Tax=Marinobacter azerbaijanicus TaxID=3050455 RepID=A0ABT7I980_9GAMM|nr:glycosyltransferase [Marinobacter sp. TBZ242]MDL0429719.1 glycosyltransferase [Marinobacter sp. TBZ242]